jgi:hypothetical protein
MEAPAEQEGRISFAFRTAIARTPSSAEVQLLKAQYEKNLNRFQVNKDAASKLVAVGLSPRPTNLDVVEHAAWTSVCGILLNLDEAIMRE